MHCETYRALSMTITESNQISSGILNKLQICNIMYSEFLSHESWLDKYINFQYINIISSKEGISNFKSTYIKQHRPPNWLIIIDSS